MIDPTSVGYRLKRPSVPAFRLLLPAEEADATLKLNTLFIAELEKVLFSFPCCIFRSLELQ
jgi:hypothetical protein